MKTQLTNPEVSIAIVEDNSIYAKVIEKELFNRKFINFKTYATGEEFFEKQKEPVDVLILDYHLDSVNPNAMDGLEVIKKLKTVFPDTYVIMLSADDNINVAVVALRHGAHEYIVKSETASTRLEMALNAIRNAINQTRDLKDSKKVNVVMLVVYILVILAVYALSLLYPGLFKMG